MSSMSPEDDMMLTLILLFACLCIGAISYYQGSKPWLEPRPRMVPWMPIMLACAATSLMLIVHLVNLLGFSTGGGLPGMR